MKTGSIASLQVSSTATARDLRHQTTENSGATPPPSICMSIRESNGSLGGFVLGVAGFGKSWRPDADQLPDVAIIMEPHA